MAREGLHSFDIGALELDSESENPPSHAFHALRIGVLRAIGVVVLRYFGPRRD